MTSATSLSPLRWLMAPGASLMRRLSYPAKMVLLGAVVVLAMLTLAALSLWALHAGAEPPPPPRPSRGR